MLKIVTFLATAASVCAHPFGGPLAPSQRMQVLSHFVQLDTARRTPAIARLRADGSAVAGADVKAALARIDTVATNSMKNLFRLTKPTNATVESLRRDFLDWKAAADVARALVQTDQLKDRAKFAEMDRACQKAEKAFDKLTRGLKPGGTSEAARLIEGTTLVAQIRREQLWADNKPADISTLAIGDLAKSEKPDIGLEQFVVEMEPFLSLREHHRIVTGAHAQMKTAEPEAVQFAELLNGRRFILGMKPLLLGEKLSAACARHSEEMVKLKYFAHESPVPANKTPWDRVRNAGFEGRGHGECIHAGGSEPREAHTGWWYSDGHRVILYSEATAQGIAKFGRHWTFMTGSFAKFPL